jgi:sensor histidine kinase YesM
MIKDKILRIVFIPLLGIIIPYFSGIISYSRYSFLSLVAGHLYFIFLSFLIWQGSSWIHHSIRQSFSVRQNPYIKIASIGLISTLFGGAISWLFAIMWIRFSPELFNWGAVFKISSFTALAVVLFTLIYEVLYLSKEREIDEQVVSQLDFERSKAEMSVLQKQLEPHFIFNSLNALSYLIKHDAETAHDFNSKLASVYKYFLINKDKELIALDEELDFISNYFFLLQIRHDYKLKLRIKLDQLERDEIMILPCALQLLVENAIKHNVFDDAGPLEINITQDGDYITIWNYKKPKSSLDNTTQIGLRNLSARYRFVCSKDIIIQSSHEKFRVMLPLINKNLVECLKP